MISARNIFLNFCELACTVLLLGILSCKTRQNSKWVSYIHQVGTYSSPRSADLNRDGILDIVMGAGGREERYCDTAVVALDGATGKALWAIPGHNQYTGSAVFADITNDGIPDVFIGGRWAQFVAIDGARGELLWSFYTERRKTDGSDGGWYNFTSPQIIPDQDGDHLPDLIVANGGDAHAKADDTLRPAGRLLVLSSRTGKILANVVVPDGRETYMSVICEEQPDGTTYVLFGTGGETIGGHLYRTSLSDIMRGDISGASILATNRLKGFVSSPVLADINSDGINDIICSPAEGRLIAIDGKTCSIIWQTAFPGTEAYTVPAVGFFNKDSIPDFFASFAIGVFPKLEWSIRFMVDGLTGRIEYLDTIPSFQYASAIAADLDGDGYDEVLVNQSAFRRKQFEHVYYSYLMVFDFVHHKKIPIGDTLPATNFASTPWIGDLDNDGYFDIIYSAVNFNDVRFDLETPLGLWQARCRTGIKIKKPVRWGAFMGNAGTGIFNNR